ncbi:MAG: UDP-N-acetyl glucosamine 2-epimerase, partial [Solirubrobacteraceae bacterium]
MRILTVVGNRPQFVKAAAVSRPLRERHDEVLVHTGQHHDDALSAVFFRELDLPAPDHELALGGGTNLAQTARMIEALEPLVDDVAPDVLLVYGDTNSTLAGALVAAARQVPLVHVEAGMRSFDRRMPEERNRVVCDHLSALLLVPTATATANLRAEGIDGARVVDVG